MRWIKGSIWGGLLALAVLGLMIGTIEGWVQWRSQDRLYDQANQLPNNHVGLVLGTSQYTLSGHKNPYFSHRIEAAAMLYHQGKIKRILVSGDNGHASYNEPVAMRKALVEQGVNPEHIYLDYAGFRTLDSIIRAHKVFGQPKFTVISQRFHNQRALFIAGFHQLDVVAYNARDVGVSMGLKTQLRERLARVKAFLDLYLFRTEPRFLGEPVLISSRH